MEHYKIHCWEHEIEPGHVLAVRYEEDSGIEDVTIEIGSVKQTLRLYADEVKPLIEMLQNVQATLDARK